MMRSKLKCLLSLLLLIFNFVASNVANAQSVNRNPRSNVEYLNTVKYYRYLDPDSAAIFALEGLKIAKEASDSSGQAALLNQLGMIDDNAARYSEAKEKYLIAESIYRELGDSKGLVSILVRLSVVEKRKGNYDKSLAFAMKALKLSEKIKDKLGMLEARVIFAEIYYVLKNYKESLANLTIAEGIDRTIPVSNFTLNMYIAYGYLYIKLGDWAKAIEYVNKGLAKADRVEFNGLKISLYKVLALAYAEKGDHAKSVSYFKYTLEFARKIKNSMREQSILIELSHIYEKSIPDSALFYLNSALQIADRFKMPRQQIIILDKMSSLYKGKGQILKALTLKERSAQIAEQYFYKDMSKQVVSLEAAYDLEKSNAKLRELTLKSDTERLQKDIFLYLSLATLFVLLVTLAFYFKTRQLNDRLRKANSELEESSNVKDKFFSIVAHDIRSPLVSTISILELIDDKDIDEVSKASMVTKLIGHCKNSLSILDKLLKWGQMQIKGVRLNQQVFHPTVNIERNIALWQEAALKKDINIDVNVGGDLKVFADSDHFDFVIRNLVGNAIKFTNTGGHIEVLAVDNEENVVFTVKDNGVGISEGRIKKLFKLSAMGTRGTSSEEGTSLGLIICKEFIEANNGKLTVESTVGSGTTFSFLLKKG